MRAVITVLGKDMVGILAKASTACAESNANVVEVTQSVLEDYFAMIMLVDIDKLNCSLEEIAKLNNTSISNIKILFKKYCGLSPKIYYQRLRCTEAIRLMSEGLSSSETANKLNFSSPNYFNTFFKRITGTPPQTFIKKTYHKK